MSLYVRHFVPINAIMIVPAMLLHVIAESRGAFRFGYAELVTLASALYAYSRRPLYLYLAEPAGEAHAPVAALALSTKKWVRPAIALLVIFFIRGVLLWTFTKVLGACGHAVSLPFDALANGASPGGYETLVAAVSVLALPAAIAIWALGEYAMAISTGSCVLDTPSIRRSLDKGLGAIFTPSNVRTALVSGCPLVALDVVAPAFNGIRGAFATGVPLDIFLVLKPLVLTVVSGVFATYTFVIYRDYCVRREGLDLADLGRPGQLLNATPKTDSPA